MENELDVRTCIELLWKHRVPVLVITFLFGLGTLGVLTLFPKYEATALVAVTRPLYQYQFSPNIQNITDKEATLQFTGKAGVELASGDFLLQNAMDALKKKVNLETQSLSDFKRRIKVSVGIDPSVIKFTARSNDPKTAAEIANTLANLYVHFVNEIYGQSSSQQKFFEEQLIKASEELRKAEQALIDFEKRNDELIVKAQLDSNLNALSTYLALNKSLNLLHKNVLGLKRQLARYPGDRPSSIADDLASLMLQINAFYSQQVDPQANIQSNKASHQTPTQVIIANQLPTAPSLPLQLQLPEKGNLLNKTVGEQSAYLDDLASTIESRMADIRKQSDALPKTILVLQGRLQQVMTESAELNRRQSIAKRLYTFLAEKTGETRITAQESSGRVRMAGHAVTPDRPAGRRLMKSMVASLIGFLMTCFAVFAYEYIRRVQIKK